MDPLTSGTRPTNATSHALVTLLLAWPVAAAALQPGSYRCWSSNVSGAGGGCALAPPIEIRADGTYRESSASGTWHAKGDRLHLSASTVRGPGVISGNRITFEYKYRDWHHTVTYLCRDCSAAPAAESKQQPTLARTTVWAAVRLAFDQGDGYLGWINSAYLVPVEAASEFAQADSAALPVGGSMGSAYQDGKLAVVANFRQAGGGRDYVVFVDSGRQRMPVARVSVPASPAEQTLSVPATLKFDIASLR